MIPFDQRVGVCRGIRSFRLATWPGPLSLCGPVNGQCDTLAVMALAGGSGTGQQVGHVVRWQLDAAQATEEEEIRGSSLPRRGEAYPGPVGPLIITYRDAGMPAFDVRRVLAEELFLLDPAVQAQATDLYYRSPWAGLTVL